MWARSVFLLAMFAPLAQGETNLIKRLPDAHEAVERCREQMRSHIFYETAKKSLPELEAHRTQNDDQIIKLFHGRSDAYLILEWFGGFQEGYNIVVLTEKEAVLLRSSTSEICAVIRLSPTYATRLHKQVRRNHAVLDDYYGGSSTIEHDTALMFCKIVLSPTKTHSIVINFPDTSHDAMEETENSRKNSFFSRFMTVRKKDRKRKHVRESQGYYVLGSVMAVLKQAIAKRDFVPLYSSECSRQGEPALRTDFFDGAF